MSSAKDTGAGGAAAHSGVDFQQRLAAWFAAAMLSHIDVSPTLGIDAPLYVERISMETADSIDDFVLECEQEYRVFFQAKTSPSLSANPTTEFGKAVAQFVRQHLSEPRMKDAYVLAVAPTASSSIKQHLRKLLLAIRYDPTAWETAPLSEAEKNALDTFRNLVAQLSSDAAGSAWSAEQLTSFARKIHVATFDLDDSGSDCRSAHVLLHALVEFKVPTDLIWSRLVQMCLDLARKRLQITRTGLEKTLARFMQDTIQEVQDTMFFDITQSGLPSTGREMLLVEDPESESAVFLFELCRFDNNGNQQIQFSAGNCSIAGHQCRVIRRSATFVGMERFLVRNAQSFRDRQFYVVPADFDENPDLGTAARTRALWIKDRLQRLREGFACIQCGLPVSGTDIAVVEVDDAGHAPDAGVVHNRCIQPTFRVLGELRSEFFAENRHVLDFDLKLWVEKLHAGQGMLSGLGELGGHPNVTVGWNAEPMDTSPRHCIRVQLASGARPPVMRRGKVHRLSAADAEKIATQVAASLADGVREGDPFCMSDDGLKFGTRSQRTALVSSGSASECLSVRVEPYTRVLGKQYDQNAQYYAPLIAIRVGASDSYLQIDGRYVLLSDVLRVEEHFLNWASAGILVPEYYLEIIPDDDAFDAFMRRVVAEGRTTVVDPIVTTSGAIVSGLPIVPLTTIV